jgi:hypothetical protein
MMKVVQRIGALLILMVFLFGTIGLSVLRHRCNSSKQNSVTLYAEIFNRSQSSCCDDEPAVNASSCYHKFKGSEMSESIDPAPCCKSTISFFKLEIFSFRGDNKIFKIVPFDHSLFPLFFYEIEPYEQPDHVPAHFQFYAPPLFGKTLVYFLHQVKIPAHPSVS